MEIRKESERDDLIPVKSNEVMLPDSYSQLTPALPVTTPLFVCLLLEDEARGCMCGSTASYACAYVTAGEDRMYLSDCVFTEFKDGKSVKRFAANTFT